MSDTNVSGSFRVKKINFTQVSNSALRDNSLSLKAKGLYSLIQSYITIPDFTLYKGYLISVCREKEKAFDSAWKELKVNGYLKQYRIPKGKNDSFVYEYDLLDIADLTTPPLINLNKNGEEITSTKEENSHTPHLAPYANSTLCEAHPMPNVGGINNTDFNNIDLIYTESKSSQSQTGQMTLTVDHEPAQQIIPDIKKEPLNPIANQSTGLTTAYVNTQFPTDDYTTYEEIIKSNIDYTNFSLDSINISLVDNIVACMIDFLCTEGETIAVEGNIKPRELVKSVYLKLNHDHIEYVVDQYKTRRNPIIHKAKYIKVMLFNSYHEADAHVTNQVRVDGFVY